MCGCGNVMFKKRQPYFISNNTEYEYCHTCGNEQPLGYNYYKAECPNGDIYVEEGRCKFFTYKRGDAPVNIVYDDCFRVEPEFYVDSDKYFFETVSRANGEDSLFYQPFAIRTATSKKIAQEIVPDFYLESNKMVVEVRGTGRKKEDLDDFESQLDSIANYPTELLDETISYLFISMLNKEEYQYGSSFILDGSAAPEIAFVWKDQYGLSFGKYESVPTTCKSYIILGFINFKILVIDSAILDNEDLPLDSEKFFDQEPIKQLRHNYYRSSLVRKLHEI